MEKHQRKATLISIEEITVQSILDFLSYLEQQRNNSIHTRNYRLAALHSFFNFVASKEPLLFSHCKKMTSIPFKKGPQTPVTYLEKEELDAIFATINLSKPEGQRDYALILLMYNSGARVEEISRLTKDMVSFSKPYRIEILGKGSKWRTIPLWEITIEHLKKMLSARKDNSSLLFLNHLRAPLTRFGISYIIQKYKKKASFKLPGLEKKNVSPHTVRHSTAVHMLQSGVDLNTIRYWLGHASLSTTHHYARINFKMLREVIDQWNIGGDHSEKNPAWKADNSLLEWLESL